MKKKENKSYWGYAYVRYRAEKKIAERLQNSGVLCYLPTIPHTYMMHSTKIITQIPIFPCYLFLCVSREIATNLRYKKKQILRIDLQFDEIKEHTLINELKALQQCEELAKSSPVYINPGIKIGDKVLVNEGSLKGLVADVVCCDDSRSMIIVNVTMLEQHLEFPISTTDLTKLI